MEEKRIEKCNLEVLDLWSGEKIPEVVFAS